MLIAQAHVSLTPRTFGKDAKFKAVQKACYYIYLCMQQSQDFDKKIKDEILEQIKIMIKKYILDLQNE